MPVQAAVAIPSVWVMAQVASTPLPAQVADCGAPRRPRHTARAGAAVGLSPPIPLPLALAAQPELVTLVLQLVPRAVLRDLLGQARLKSDECHAGAVTLIQRFGLAANLNAQLYCLMLDGVYRGGGDGVPAIVELAAPTDEELHALLQTRITRLTKLLTRRSVSVVDMG
jgi:hypothetical protein